MKHTPRHDVDAAATPPKRLMPEVLPTPEPVIPSVTPRARVSHHLRGLMQLGVASLSFSCGPMVCDPLPPPAQCRNTGSVLSSIQVTATRASSTTVDVAVHSLEQNRTDAVRLTLLTVTGGTATQQPSPGGTIITERVTPASPASVIELTFTATCEGAAAKSIRVVLTPLGLDGGAADGGAAASYTVTVSEQ